MYLAVSRRPANSAGSRGERLSSRRRQLVSDGQAATSRKGWGWGGDQACGWRRRQGDRHLRSASCPPPGRLGMDEDRGLRACVSRGGRGARGLRVARRARCAGRRNNVHTRAEKAGRKSRSCKLAHYLQSLSDSKARPRSRGQAVRRNLPPTACPWLAGAWSPRRAYTVGKRPSPADRGRLRLSFKARPSPGGPRAGGLATAVLRDCVRGSG